QRVELGEVESALRAHPAVRAAFVTARLNGRGEKEIIGYAVLDEPGAVPAIRAQLRDTLPQFAVPTHLITVDELPLTPNGKIDRRRLPEPAAAPVEPAPATVLDATGVRGAWQDVLEHGSFGDEDNFFDVGGHSLLL